MTRRTIGRKCGTCWASRCSCTRLRRPYCRLKNLSAITRAPCYSIGMITLRDIEASQAVVTPHIHKTPLLYSRSLSEMTGAEVFVKAENLQKTGAFKVRGAFSKMSRLGKGPVAAA